MTGLSSKLISGYNSNVSLQLTFPLLHVIVEIQLQLEFLHEGYVV